MSIFTKSPSTLRDLEKGFEPFSKWEAKLKLHSNLLPIQFYSTEDEDGYDYYDFQLGITYYFNLNDGAVYSDLTQNKNFGGLSYSHEIRFLSPKLDIQSIYKQNF